MVSLYDTVKWMGKHEKTLVAIFADPIRASLKGRAIVALNGIDASFHRPHPSPNTDKGAVRSVRQFLIDAGVAL